LAYTANVKRRIQLDSTGLGQPSSEPKPFSSAGAVLMRFPKSGFAKKIRAASCLPSYQGSAVLSIQPGGSDLSLKAKSKNNPLSCARRFKWFKIRTSGTPNFSIAAISQLHFDSESLI
jgi:hypothetical protein